ncbi:uncharacterized protein LOC119768617 [Culex quinquefasciatus]|uniref:uncharacterized protein LOC119768617 n=1 Tax=Culex quinquefasciatus TaxID=7176 RepID=UPI0018E32258|nr:uncharacterized protein LOC119768617 [Culex quinquefasciatus]
MKVDQRKEIGGGDETFIEHLPTEILLMIFRKLTFRQLVRASAVSHRWNELMFYLLKDRVKLRIQGLQFSNTEEWAQNRKYAALTFDAVRFGLPKGFNARWLEPLAENVKHLRFYCKLANDGALLELLRPFGAVEELLVKADELDLSKALSSYLRLCRGLLPNLRRLTIGCRYVRMMGLLKEVAPRLVSLDLELLPRLLTKLYVCRFENLESLTLRFPQRQTNIPNMLSFLRCLQEIKDLRKLGLFVNDCISVFRAAFALTSVDDLTLGGTFTVEHFSQIFDDIHRMTNLRSLSIFVITKQFLTVEAALPSLDSLCIGGTIKVNVSILTEKFPNITLLMLTTRTFDWHEVQEIANAWQSTMQHLAIEIRETDQSVIASILTMLKLRKLYLYLNEPSENHIAALIPVACMATLEELHILDKDCKQDATLAELCNCKRSCTIFIGGSLIEDVLADG